MKYFTYVGDAHTTSETRDWHGQRVKQRTRYSRDPRHLGLLFVDTEGSPSLAERELVVKDPLVQRTIGEMCVVTPFDTHSFIVSPDLGFKPVLPDAATPEDYVQIGTKNGLASYSLRARFNTCLSLLKSTVGCAQCPDKNNACLAELIPARSRPKAVVELEKDDLKAAFQNEKSKVGGYTFISPRLTGEIEFLPTFRHPSEHCFDTETILSWKKDLRARAQHAAGTQRFRRTECKLCPVQKACPKHKVQTCAGRYPPEAETTRQVMATWLPRLKEKNPFAPWQFWTLAHAAGKSEGSYREFSSRRMKRIVLEGLTWSQSQGWRAKVLNCRGADCAYETDDYDTVATHFGLPRDRQSALGTRWPKKPPKETQALFFACLDVHRGPSRRGWYGNTSHPVNFRRIDGSSVELSIQCDNFAWAGGYTTTLTTWNDYFALREGVNMPVPHLNGEWYGRR